MKQLYIIEDDPDLMGVLTLSLEDRYELLQFNDARAALLNLQIEKPPFLILLDLIMPGFSGEQFLEEYAHLGLKVPILVMSSYSNVEAHVNNSSVVGILPKPLDMELINTIIEAIV